MKQVVLTVILILVAFVTGPFYISAQGSCNLPAINVCETSHIFANDNRTYSFGDGRGDTYVCITIGSNFTGTINYEWHAQEVENYLCIAEGATATIGNSSRPGMRVTNYGTFDINHRDAFVNWGPSNSIDNYGTVNVNANNVTFHPTFEYVQIYPGSLFRSVGNNRNLRFVQTQFLGEGTVISTQDLLFVNGAVGEITGDIQVNRDINYENGSSGALGGSITVGRDYIQTGNVIISGGVMSVAHDFEVGWGYDLVINNAEVHLMSDLTIRANAGFFDSQVIIDGNFISSYGFLIEIEGSELTTFGFIDLDLTLNISASTVIFHQNILVGSGFEVTVTDSEFTVLGNIVFESDAKLILNNSLLYIDGNVELKSSSAELNAQESEIDIFGNTTFGSAGKMSLESTTLNIVGDLTFLSSNGLLEIDLSIINVTGNADFNWNCGIVFLNCGLLSATGNIKCEGPVTGPGSPAGLIAANGNIVLQNTQAVTSGFVDFCAGNNFTHSTAPPLGPDITQCEYDLNGFSSAGSREDSPFPCENIILAVEFLDFKVLFNETTGSVDLEWVAFEEQENLTYTVMKGKAPDILQPVETIGVFGSGTTISHSFSDGNLTNGRWYYQIKSENEIGKTTYSPTRIAIISEVISDRGFMIFPNPVRDYFFIEVENGNFNANFTDETEAVIIDPGGKKMKVISMNGNQLYNGPFDISDLPRGTYFLMISDQIKPLFLK